MNNNIYQKIALLPIIFGGLFGMVFAVLWSQNIVPQWSLMLGAIPLLIGGFFTTALRSMEYKPGEPSYRCECGYDVYCSSKTEHDKTCEVRHQ